MKHFIIVLIALLLLSLSESKTSPANHLRGPSSQDDIQEHSQEEQDGSRMLQTTAICAGGIKTNMFKGNISMQSMFKPLNCSPTALADIGRVIDAVFDDVVKSNKALAPLTLNTTVCPTPVITTCTSNSFNFFKRRRLATTSYATKYVYRAGKSKCPTVLCCTLLHNKSR